MPIMCGLRSLDGMVVCSGMARRAIIFGAGFGAVGAMFFVPQIGTAGLIPSAIFAAIMGGAYLVYIWRITSR